MNVLLNCLGYILEVLFSEYGLVTILLVSLLAWSASNFATAVMVLALPAILVLFTLGFIDVHNKVVEDIRKHYTNKLEDHSVDTIDDL